MARSLLVLIAACSASPDEPGEVEDTDVATARRWPDCDPAATSQTVSFVHMNDMHGHYDIDDSGAANVARIRGFFEATREENPFAIFTNGGDDYEKGSVVEALSSYASTREVSTAMGFDVRVIGNHDLSWSREELLRYSHDPRAIVLASNLEYLGEDPGGFGAVTYAELEVGCLRIGFMGAVSAPWTEENTQYTGNYYDEFPTDLDFVETHRRLIAEHRDDVDLLVAVSHLGFGDDVLVAEQTEGLDAILGGHSHTVMMQEEVVADRTLVVQAGSYAQFVARLDLEVDLATRRVTDHAYNLRFVATDLPPDVETEAEVAAILDHYGPERDEVVGRTKNAADKLGAARIAALGAVEGLDLDAAAMKASAAFDGLPRGDVTPQDLFEAFLIERQPPGTPGWTATYTASIRGADLARLAELDPTAWAVVLPPTIDPAETYQVALPKFAAFHPENWLPAGVTLSDVTFAKETWETLLDAAEDRQGRCRYLDVDEAIPGCR